MEDIKIIDLGILIDDDDGNVRDISPVGWKCALKAPVYHNCGPISLPPDE